MDSGSRCAGAAAAVPRNRAGPAASLPSIRKPAAEVTDQEPTIMDKKRKPEILISAKIRRTGATQFAYGKSRARNSPQMRDKR